MAAENGALASARHRHCRMRFVATDSGERELRVRQGLRAGVHPRSSPFGCRIGRVSRLVPGPQKFSCRSRVRHRVLSFVNPLTSKSFIRNRKRMAEHL